LGGANLLAAPLIRFSQTELKIASQPFRQGMQFLVTDLLWRLFALLSRFDIGFLHRTRLFRNPRGLRLLSATRLVHNPLRFEAMGSR
jgi:hypothetical protein